MYKNMRYLNQCTTYMVYMYHKSDMIYNRFVPKVRGLPLKLTFVLPDCYEIRLVVTLMSDDLPVYLLRLTNVQNSSHSNAGYRPRSTRKIGDFIALVSSFLIMLFQLHGNPQSFDG